MMAGYSEERPSNGETTSISKVVKRESDMPTGICVKMNSSLILFSFHNSQMVAPVNSRNDE